MSPLCFLGAIIKNESKYELEIRVHHLDTFSHVNNATYLTLLEDARWEWLGENGITLKEIQRAQRGPVILEIHIKFSRELKLGEKILIETKKIKSQGKIGEMSQKIFNQKQELSAEAILKFGIMDFKERKLVDLPDNWVELMSSPL